MHDAEELKLKEILERKRPRPFKSAGITATREELIKLAMDQNFVPVTDDDGGYIGIVTRRNIIKYFVGERTAKPRE